jgi:uncharacterized protein (TIGR00297 family)
MIYSLLLGLFFAFIVAFISYKVKFLTLSGSIATFILAGLIFGLGGIKWSVPILTFFILSSLLSKLRKKKNEEVDAYFEKTGVRDAMQVLANGGIGGILVIIYSFHNSDLLYLLYIASLAAVCSDTWATEIGTWRKTNTYNILNFKPIPQGLSGGISLQGTLGAFAGAAVIAASGLLWNNLNLPTYFFYRFFLEYWEVFLIVSSGLQFKHNTNVILVKKLPKKFFIAAKNQLM